MNTNSREKKEGRNNLGFYKNPKLKRLKTKQEGKKQLYETVILHTCVVFLLFQKRGHKTRERKRKREERTPNDVLLFTSIRFYIVFLFLYIIYYTHTNKRVIISETTQIIRRCSRSLNENTREVTLTLCTQKRVSSLYRSFLNACVSSFWYLAALRTNALGGSESVRFEYILLAFSDVPIVSKLCGALTSDEMSADIFLYTYKTNRTKIVRIEPHTGEISGQNSCDCGKVSEIGRPGFG